MRICTLMWCNTYHLPQKFKCTYFFFPSRDKHYWKSPPQSLSHLSHEFTATSSPCWVCRLWQPIRFQILAQPSPSVWHRGICLTSRYLSYLLGEDMTITLPTSLSHCCAEWLTHVKHNGLFIHRNCSVVEDTIINVSRILLLNEEDRNKIR